MKIALYSTLILEYGGGLEKYLIELATNLSSDKDVDKIDIITMDDNFANKMTDLQTFFYFRKMDKSLNYRENIDDINAKLAGSANYIKCHTLKELRETLKEYDVIYTKNELIETFLIKSFLGYKNLPPIILGGHTPLEYVNAQSKYAKVHNFLYGGTLYKFLAGKAAGYHAINAHEESLYKQLFTNDKVKLINNPFDMASYAKSAKDNTYDLHTSHDNINIMWAARLTEQKGVRDLVKLIESTHADKKIVWHIFGDGELRPLVDALVSQRSDVFYYGHMDQKYMSNIFSQCDFFVSTSKWEGYPYNLLEAMSHKLKIVAFDIPGVRDVLQTYSAGYTVNSITEMRSAVEEALSQNDELATYDEQQFEKAIIYQKLLDLFRNSQHNYGK